MADLSPVKPFPGHIEGCTSHHLCSDSVPAREDRSKSGHGFTESFSDQPHDFAQLNFCLLIAAMNYPHNHIMLLLMS